MNSNSNISDEMFEIDFKMLINAVLARIKMIILFAVVCGLSAFLISKFVIIPKYCANVTMCVSNNKTIVADGLDFNDVNASITLVPTYIQLIQSNTVLGEVAAKTNELGYTAKDIGGMISISGYDDTQIINLEVVNPNPEHANIIANAMAVVAPDKMEDLMEGAAVKVIDESVLPEEPFSPSTKKNTLLGFILGAFIGIAIAVIIEMLDTSVKSESDLNSMYPDLPVLGVIPEFTMIEENSSKSDTNGDWLYVWFVYKKNQWC